MILSFLFCYHVLATTVLVRQDDETCFWESVRKGEEFHHSYEITSGLSGGKDADGVQVKLFDSEDNIIIDLEQDKESEAISFIATKDGPITWCFKNWSQNLVTIDWEVHIGDAVMIKYVAEKDHFTPMERGIARMQGNVNAVHANIRRYNSKLWILSKRSRTTVSRQTMFKLSQTLLCFAVSAIQGGC